MLFDGWGDDEGGVIRTDVLRRVSLHDSYHFADRTFTTEIGLHGPFYMVPDWLYFRRQHAGQGGPQSDRARPLRQPGPAAREPAAASSSPALRRIHLGLRRGHQACAAVARRSARVLSAAWPVGGQQGPAGGRPDHFA